MANAPGAPLMTFHALAQAVKGECISRSGPADGGFDSVALDSRSLRPGALFVALPGSTQDGHRYVEAAFKSGAAGAMVARSQLEDPGLGLRKQPGVLVAVEDTLRGLQDAARCYLDRFPHLLRIGITGSSGKTTTKEIAAAMIGQEKQVVMNPGNLNSETGLPLAVFAVRDCHEVGIFEMGMNRKGEIEELARVLKPQIALITNIGTAHIGKIGSRLAILYEKRRIFSQFTGIETALLPRDNADGELLAQGIRGNIGFYGPDSLEELGAIAEKGLDGTDIIWGGISVSFGLPGRHNVKNALAAAAIAKAVPVGPDAIRAGLGAVKPLFGRGEIIRGALQGRRWYAKDGAPASPQPVTVIRDCYNANPESMEEALAFCDALEWPGRRVYVIGAMGELGPASPGAHKKLGAALAASRADRVFLYGPEAKSAAGQGRKVPFVYTDTMSDLSAELGAYIRPGDLVLLKGSRGCALERALEGIFLEYKARE